jgi:hypothetical protein
MVYTIPISLSLAEAFWPVATGVNAEPPENSYGVPVGPESVRNAFFQILAEEND